MSRRVGFLLLLALAGCAAGPLERNRENPQVDLGDSLNRLSYAAGYQLGDMFQNQKLSLVPDAVVKGMYDARKNIQPVLTKAEMKRILRDPKAFLLEASGQAATSGAQEGEAFLRLNGKREGVITLASGLQYRILHQGQGKRPQPGDRVRMTYVGKQLDGSIFDSTARKGEAAEVGVGTLVPGLVEGLPLMREGARWEFFLPSRLAYGKQGPLAEKTLIFEVELLAILPATP